MCWWETRDASRLTRFANNRADCMDFFSRENLCSCVDRNSSVLCAFEGRGLIRNCGPFLQSPLVCLSVPTPLSIWGGGNCAGSTQVCTHTHTHTHTHCRATVLAPQSLHALWTAGVSGVNLLVFADKRAVAGVDCPAAQAANAGRSEDLRNQ